MTHSAFFRTADIHIPEADLHAYVDGQLDAERTSAIRRYLLAHSDTARRVRDYLDQRDALRVALAHVAMEPIPIQLDLQRLIQQRLAQQHRWSVWRAAAGALLAIGLTTASMTGGWFLRGGIAVPAALEAKASSNDRLLDEIADYHAAYARETIHQVEVPASETAHIESWLGDRLHRRLQVPDLSSRGLEFTGARLLVVDGAPVADLVYHWPGREHQPVALCITFASGPEEAPRLAVRDDIQQISWQHNGYAYVIAGWMNPTTLQELANELMPQLGMQA